MNPEMRNDQEMLSVHRILAWQTAHMLGYQDEEEMRAHAALVLVDYAADTVTPVVVGKFFENPAFSQVNAANWSQRMDYVLAHYIDESLRDEIRDFWSYDSAREKYNNGKVFDDLDYLSKVHDVPKWTHAVQYLIEQDGRLMCYCWIIEVDNFRRNQNAIVHMAEHDSLTGLYNRHKLTAFQTGRNACKVTYILMDVNRFKHVNDKYGHDAGDRALVALAERLGDVFYHRRNNLVFRLGGDEFLVIAIDMPEKQLIECLEMMSEPVWVELEDGSSISITVSIGCADNMKDADAALYRVKEHGRKGYYIG